MYISKRFILVALAVLTTGCAYNLPAGYVKVDPPYDVKFRAVSAEGSALSLRTETNPENGDLAFWDKVIKNRMTEVRGYKIVDHQQTKHKSGLAGIEMTFDYNRDGIDYLYTITLYVKNRRVHVFESAGEKNKISGDLAEIRKAVNTWPLM
ncbi:MAG: hypothetical protein ACYTF1_12755 [Planctomycetota bacterium]|jgi:hypothetical protein